MEKTQKIVMDGHHRLAAARILGLSFIPTVLYQYDEVQLYSRRREYDVNTANVVERARRGTLYPPKTTRHVFPHTSHPCFIPLIDLRPQTEFDQHIQWIWNGGKVPQIQITGARYSHTRTTKTDALYE